MLALLCFQKFRPAAAAVARQIAQRDPAPSLPRDADMHSFNGQSLPHWMSPAQIVATGRAVSGV